MRHTSKLSALLMSVSALAVAGCGGAPRTGLTLPAASFVGSSDQVSDNYMIGAMDEITIFVWRNPELSANVQVRPDGRITTPLVADMVAVGKTPAQLADDIRQALTRYIQEPLVSVMINRPQGTFAQQVRVIGATTRPAAIPYRANMTLLDAMIAVGGLSEYAAGDRARLIRSDRATGRQRQYDPAGRDDRGWRPQRVRGRRPGATGAGRSQHRPAARI